MKLPKIFKPAPKTILVQWEPAILEDVQQAIREAERLIQQYFSEEILETTPTYTELAIYWKEEISISAFKEKYTKIVKHKKISNSITPSRLVFIPVCYCEDFGLDLAEVGRYHKIPSEVIITLHTQPIYTVSFLGFLPGFPYLKGLSEKLHTPRKVNPRQRIPKGSVGIGGNQTGVYPSNSPGGWNIIGRSPLDFFSIENEQPSLLKAGDTLKFQAISKAEFDLISLELASGVYQLITQML